MIKIENVVLPSPEWWAFVIEAMRNPLNSWHKSDSKICDGKFELGENDLNLMKRLSKAGKDHRKFMRMIPVGVRISANHIFWGEADTYKIGTVRNSCSKMHKIHAEPFTYDMFDHEGIDEVIFETNLDRELKLAYVFQDYIDILEDIRRLFNETKEKKYWRALIEMLPMGFHLTANVTLNYEVLANMYHSRKNHKLQEWRDFCAWIETLPYSELITGEEVANND